MQMFPMKYDCNQADGGALIYSQNCKFGKATPLTQGQQVPLTENLTMCSTTTKNLHRVKNSNVNSLFLYYNSIYTKFGQQPCGTEIHNSTENGQDWSKTMAASDSHYSLTVQSS